MKKVSNKLRVCHFPQIPCKPFTVEVADEFEASKIINVLAQQHLFLFKHNIIPDYSNVICVEMWDENHDGDGNAGWCDYHNEEEGMEFDEFEETYITGKKKEEEDIFILLADTNGTTLSREMPFGVAVKTEKEARRFTHEGSVGYCHSYEKVKIFDNKDDAIKYSKENKLI